MRVDVIQEMEGLIKDVEEEFKHYAILASTRNAPSARLEAAYRDFLDASDKLIQFRDRHKPNAKLDHQQVIDITP